MKGGRVLEIDIGKMCITEERLYASCSSCGRILGRALSGSDNEVNCPKCGAKINYKIADKSVTVTLLEPSRKKTSRKAQNKPLKDYGVFSDAVNQ